MAFLYLQVKDLAAKKVRDVGVNTSFNLTDHEADDPPNMSLQSTFSFDNPRSSQATDFWSEAKVPVMTSEEFKQAEDTFNSMKENEIEKGKGHAAMSFGQYCQDHVEKIRDLYPNKSPAKKKCPALVDMRNFESTAGPATQLERILGKITKHLFLKSFNLIFYFSENSNTLAARGMLLNLRNNANVRREEVSQIEAAELSMADESTLTFEDLETVRNDPGYVLTSSNPQMI
jgi:hypothetical protein